MQQRVVVGWVQGAVSGRARPRSLERAVALHHTRSATTYGDLVGAA